MPDQEPAVPMHVLQRHLRASVLQHIPVPLEVLERHLTADELETIRAEVAADATKRRGAET